MNLQGKVAVVTGGGRGIGRAIVEQLAEDGAGVVFGDINEDNVRELATSLRDKGFAVEGAIADVAKKDEIEALVESAVAANGL
jgi:NAD(P)-dependent dehydrogenase (short-subunit alcohol dehydrogenase family)